MREVEYRGICGTSKDNWYYGDLKIIKGQPHIVPRDGHDICFSVNPKTVGQYTGLEAEDSNRIKIVNWKREKDLRIFEGDIILFTYWWFDGHENDSILTGEIVYLPEVMSFGLRGVKNADWIRHIGGEEGTSDTVPFAVLTFDRADFKIIGNSFNNPELLK